jgi:hypothetical protein
LPVLGMAERSRRIMASVARHSRGFARS